MFVGPELALSRWDSQPPLLHQLQPGTALGDPVLGALSQGCAALSLERLRRGDGRDMPVGAVVYDQTSGVLCGDFARDRELGDPDGNYHHAEQRALRSAVENGADLTSSVLAVSFEPCLQCLPTFVGSGISRVLFVTERTVPEDLGLVNRRTNVFDAMARDGIECPGLTRLDHWCLELAGRALFERVTRGPDRSILYAKPKNASYLVNKHA